MNGNKAKFKKTTPAEISKLVQQKKQQRLDQLGNKYANFLQAQRDYRGAILSRITMNRTLDAMNLRVEKANKTIQKLVKEKVIKANDKEIQLMHEIQWYGQNIPLSVFKAELSERIHIFNGNVAVENKMKESLTKWGLTDTQIKDIFLKDKYVKIIPKKCKY